MTPESKPKNGKRVWAYGSGGLLGALTVIGGIYASWADVKTDSAKADEINHRQGKDIVKIETRQDEHGRKIEIVTTTVEVLKADLEGHKQLTAERFEALMTMLRDKIREDRAAREEIKSELSEQRQDIKALLQRASP